MDYLKPADFRKIKAFFKALNEGSFKVNTNIATATVLLDGVPTPVNKTECLNLLRSFPELSGEEFKDDNFLIKYLQDPSKRKHLLGKLTPQQQIELTQVFEEKPVAVGAVSEQPGEQEQPPVEESPATMAEGGGFPGIGGGGTAGSAPRRIIHIVPQAGKVEPKLVVANKSGVVAEAPPSKIYIADKSGNVVGERSLTKEGVKTPEQPKLVTANKSGVVAETPPSKIYIADKSGVVTGVRNIKSPSWLKTFRSNAQIFARKNLGRIAGGLTDIAKGVGRGIAGPGLTSTYNLLGKAANGGLNAFARLSGQRLPKIPGPSGSFLKGGRAAALGLGIFFFMAFGLALFGGATSGGATPVGTTPITAVDVNSCKLTRSDQSPKEVSLKSSVLGSYFQEAEKTTTVPAQVLAGIARLENPSFIAYADDNHDALFNRNFTDLNTSCDPHFKTSPTGALGLMQIQPAGTTGYFDFGVNYGASFFGKTSSTLTTADYCDPKKSVLLAAGFILKKLQAFYGLGDGTKWDTAWTNDKSVIDKVATTFYGCLRYGAAPDADGNVKCANPGNIYSYGDDLWSSVQSCKITISQPAAPAADPDAQILALNILNKFGVAMDKDFNYNYLKWAWEKMHDVSNTKFLSLVRGPDNSVIAVLKNDISINRQIDCRTIQLRGKNSAGIPYPEELFKVVFLHELAHIIENCYPSVAKKEQLAEIISQEGYLTFYSQNANACVGSNNLNEDFAETVTYFLNPEFIEQSLGIGAKCEPAQPINPYERNKPLHKQFATSLLLPVSLTQTPTTPAISLPKFSCPVVGGGVNRLPSYQADPINGHCGSAYNAKLTNPSDRCVGNTRRGKSIDIETDGPDGKYVGLPTIDGKPTGWEFVQRIDLAEKDCFEEEIIDPAGTGGGCGVGYIFRTPLNSTDGKNWVIHLFHMQSVDLIPGLIYQSGPVSLIGKTQAIHVHISLGQNIQNVLSQDEAGWKSADTELELCQ